ncbi:PadR family transcriptional regulator [Stackebrandtia soli]
MGFGRPRKARRGDVRAAILALLAEGPRNGYQLIQEIAERSQGAWRPSPGAVYPALQQLTEDGLIKQVGEGRRTVFELTDAGTAYVAENPSEVDNPWEAMIPQIDEEVRDLYDLASQSYAAIGQLVASGSEAQLARAKRILEDSRRGLYRILADGDIEDTTNG